MSFTDAFEASLEPKDQIEWLALEAEFDLIDELADEDPQDLPEHVRARMGARVPSPTTPMLGPEPPVSASGPGCRETTLGPAFTTVPTCQRVQPTSRAAGGVHRDARPASPPLLAPGRASGSH